MTAPDVDAIRTRLNGATPGPWRRDGNAIAQEADDGVYVLGNLPRGGTMAESADLDLMAHAPTDLAVLLGENERLRAALRRVIAASDETCVCCDCRNCRAYNDVMDDVSRSLVVPVSARSEVES